MKEKEFEKLFKALANKRRLAILNVLKHEKECTVSGIARKIKLSLRSTSKHLLILAAADIVESEQRNIQVYYSLVSNMPPLMRVIISAV